MGKTSCRILMWKQPKVCFCLLSFTLSNTMDLDWYKSVDSISLYWKYQKCVLHDSRLHEHYCILLHLMIQLRCFEHRKPSRYYFAVILCDVGLCVPYKLLSSTYAHGGDLSSLINIPSKSFSNICKNGMYGSWSQCHRPSCVIDIVFILSIHEFKKILKKRKHNVHPLNAIWEKSFNTLYIMLQSDQ